MKEYKNECKMFIKEKKKEEIDLNKFKRKRQIKIIFIINIVIIVFGIIYLNKPQYLGESMIYYDILCLGILIAIIFKIIQYILIPNEEIREEAVKEIYNEFIKKFKTVESFETLIKSEETKNATLLLEEDMKKQPKLDIQDIKTYKFFGKYFLGKNNVLIGYAWKSKLIRIDARNSWYMKTRVFSGIRKTTINDEIYIGTYLNEKNNDSIIIKNLTNKLLEIYDLFKIPFYVVIKDNYLRVYIIAYEKHLKNEYKYIYNLTNMMVEILKVIEEQEAKN